MRSVQTLGLVPRRSESLPLQKALDWVLRQWPLQAPEVPQELPLSRALDLQESSMVMRTSERPARQQVSPAAVQPSWVGSTMDLGTTRGLSLTDRSPA